MFTPRVFILYGVVPPYPVCLRVFVLIPTLPLLLLPMVPQLCPVHPRFLCVRNTIATA